MSFRHTEISYAGRATVHDVSFGVRPGEIMGLVGESGSGKTTLIKAAMGLLGRTGLVTRGDIIFEGRSIPSLSENELRRLCGPELGMVFQDCGASLCPIRTIGEQIYESMSAHFRISKEETQAKTFDMFERLSLGDSLRIWESYPFELSGGMNQRVGIAVAMLPGPAVLFADEPTSALDAAVQKQVVFMMRELRDVFGTAIILATHDIGVVSAVADSVMVLKDGKPVECGPAAKVLECPQADYTKKLLEAVPRLKRT